MINVTIDRNRISEHFKATVTVTSDEAFTKIEARATKKGSSFGKGIGICLLGDDAVSSDGVVTFSSAVNSFVFDAESHEIVTDGEYRISVFVLTEDGKWNDGAAVLTAEGESVYDTDGNRIFAKRNGSGTDEAYQSAYSGDDINNFISEVLA